MKQKLIAVLAGLIVGGSALAQGIPMPVEKLGETVNQQNGETVPFYKGYGSSIDADPKNPRRFYGLTDRGPNADGGGNVKIFLQPSFTPSIGHFEIQRDGSIRTLRTIPLINRSPACPTPQATAHPKNRWWMRTNTRLSATSTASTAKAWP